jgi:hypothetical protein
MKIHLYFTYCFPVSFSGCLQIELPNPGTGSKIKAKLSPYAMQVARGRTM